MRNHYTYRVRDNHWNLWSEEFTSPAKAIKFAKQQNAEMDQDDIDSHDFTVELQY